MENTNKIAVKKLDADELTTHREVINNFFEYLDSLSEMEYDANSLTGHSEDYFKSI